MFFTKNKTPTQYELEKARQMSARLQRSKMRLATIAEQLESANMLNTALELFDVLTFIEQNTPADFIECGLVLSDCGTLRKSNKLGLNKYTIETDKR
jgi:hypothetical protein